MDGFQVGQFIVIGIYTQAEEQAGVAAIDDFVVPELYHYIVIEKSSTSRIIANLDEIRLIFLIPRRN
jgi:hypothetical protein